MEEEKKAKQKEKIKKNNKLACKLMCSFIREQLCLIIVVLPFLFLA